MQLEELERQTELAVQCAIMARAMGAQAEVPDPQAVRANFLRDLEENPVEEDPDQFVKMRALGISRGR